MLYVLSRAVFDVVVSDDFCALAKGELGHIFFARPLITAMHGVIAINEFLHFLSQCNCWLVKIVYQ